jgi:tRNA wybutosine-synthesizing protein 2
MAVYSKPKKIYACEMNPAAYYFLQKNVEKNDVNDIVVPIIGDCKKNAPKSIADRVIMGYIQNTRSFIRTAIESLKNKKGIIHYHDTYPDIKIPDITQDIIQSYSTCYNKQAKINYFHKIKSYAPGISHYVFDIEIK